MTPPRAERVLVEVGPDLLRFFARRVEPRDDAADLLAETLLAAWRRVDELPDDDEGARRWLFGVARNVLLNARRGSRRRTRLAARVRDLLGAPPASAADAGDEVRDAIRRLPPDLAELVTLVHWEGFRLVDAAEIVGIPAATARSRYARAKELLRDALAVTSR